MLVDPIPVILSTLGGYLMGSLGKAESWVQAIDTGQIDVGLAMVVANMNFGNVEIVVVVIYSITSW